MTWKSHPETEQFVREIADTEVLGELFALSYFVRQSTHLQDLDCSTQWTDAIHLTAAGDQLLDLAGKSSEFGENYLRFSLFAKLFHLDILIDWEKTSANEIAALSWEMLQSKMLALPYIHERYLYDRFNDEFAAHTNRVDHLTPTQTKELLDGSPIGVFQIGSLITGPLGLIKSDEKRWVPPSSGVPLWHCSDLGCEKLHFVKLEDSKTKSMRAMEHVFETARQEFGPASEWLSTLRHMSINWASSQERPYSDLLPCIGSCIVAQDRSRLVEAALHSTQKSRLREVLINAPRSSELRDVDAAALADRMTSAEQLQLLGLLSNSDLVKLIDNEIYLKHIFVAPEEIRTARIGFNIGNGFPTEISSLGIRARRNEPLIRLRHLLLDYYQKYGNLDDLDWHIRRLSERTRETVLSSYIRKNGPASAVQNLILHERKIFENVLNDYDVVPSSDDEVVKDRILWKLGFVVPRYGTELRDLERRLKDFEYLLLKLESAEQEADREKIRSVGVNLFVSWEDTLERMIAYCTWCFGSDHFATSRFEYNRKLAVQCVSDVLGESLETGENQATWDRNGQNTLGVLEQYLNRLGNWMEERISIDRLPLRRKSEDLPHYADHRDVVFPFRHTVAWADFNRREFEKLTARVKEIAQKVARANLSNLRNSIDHKRSPSDFPTIEELLAFTTRMTDVFRLIDRYRLIPKRYWVTKREVDQFGVGSWLLHDYSGQAIELQIPSPIHRMAKPQFKKPLIVGPGYLLGRHNSPLLFSVKSSGEYATYWSGYPRRRAIPPIVESDTEVTPTSNEEEPGEGVAETLH